VSPNEDLPADEAPASKKKPRSTTAFFALTSADDQPRLPRGLMVIAFSLLVVVLVVFIFKQLAEVLQPVFIATFIAYMITPAHRFLVRFRIPPVLSYGVIVLFVVVITFGLYRVTAKSAAELKEKIPDYQKKVSELRVKFDRFVLRLQSLFEKAQGKKSDDTRSEGGKTGVDDKSQPGPNEKTTRIDPSDTNIRDRIQGWISPVVTNFSGFVIGLIVIIVYLVFLIAEAETFHRRVKVFGEERGELILRVVGEINKAISEYIAIKTFICFLVAVLSTIVLGVFGVDFFLLWGILTFLFNFIPYVGSVFAAGLPIGLALLQFGFTFPFFAVAVLLLVVQNFIGYVIEPRMTGKRLDLSPLMIMLSLAFWSWLWGIVGAILAVPLVVGLKIILDHIEMTKPIAGLMSNMPAKVEAVEP